MARAQHQWEVNELTKNANKMAYAYGDVRSKNQDLFMTISKLKYRLKTIEKKKWIFKTEEKQVLTKPVTLKTSLNKKKDIVSNKKVIAPGIYKLKIDDNHDSHAEANKSVSISIGLKGVISVRMSSSTSSLRKNSVLPNTRIHPKTVEMHDRNTKKTNVTSQMNVVKNKNHVANVNVENALKANVDVLCVLCDKNVLIPYHDKCFAKYKLSVNDKVRSALFTTPRTTKSESVDTPLVVAKTRFAVVTSLTAKETDSGASQSTLLFEPVRHLAIDHLRASLIKRLRVSQRVEVIQLVLWLVDSG
ncbi:hypothetical protein Tco_1135099 [Tanacetum coccineum]